MDEYIKVKLSTEETLLKEIKTENNCHATDDYYLATGMKNYPYSTVNNANYFENSITPEEYMPIIHKKEIDNDNLGCGMGNCKLSMKMAVEFLTELEQCQYLSGVSSPLDKTMI